MDLKRIAEIQRRRERQRERESSADGDVGCSRFRSMMADMKRLGWLVPGEEKLTATLTVAAIFGDDLATDALYDLFEQHGIDKWAREVRARVDSFRHAVRSWNDKTKATFLRHCREKGVYRRRSA